MNIYPIFSHKQIIEKQHKMPQFIYTLGNKLCATDPYILDRSDMPLASDIRCFHQNLTKVEALAMDSYAQFLFYSDTQERKLVRIRMDLDADELTEKEVLAEQTGKVRGVYYVLLSYDIWRHLLSEMSGVCIMSYYHMTSGVIRCLKCQGCVLCHIII